MQVPGTECWVLGEGVAAILSTQHSALSTTSDAAIIWFTVRMAALATALLIPPALALAWLLARGTWRGKSVVETLVAWGVIVAFGAIWLSEKSTRRRT